MDIDRLIADKFPDPGHRQTAQAFVSWCCPGMREDEVIGLVYDIAEPSDMPPETHVAYLQGRLALDRPEAAQRLANWVDAGFPGATLPPETVSGEPPGAPRADSDDEYDFVQVAPQVFRMRPVGESSPPSPSAPAGPTRESLQAQLRQHEENMRAPQGSEQWNAYWRHGGDHEYRATLQALQTAPSEEPTS
jgi:hypothetical protein